ncbi:MAG: hypothetical protein LW832_10720 [Parachlamydia sp.]|jgi:hypothetical protein|nr:hypothetical protein [Parachlamydia sp.]
MDELISNLGALIMANVSLSSILSYSAHQTDQKKDSDVKGKLSAIIERILQDGAIQTYDSFDKTVYEELRKIRKFKHVNFKLTIGESNHLLFWLIAIGKTKEALIILEKFSFNFKDLLDDCRNNILHIAAFYSRHAIVEKVINLHTINDRKMKASFRAVVGCVQIFDQLSANSPYLTIL